MIYWCICWCVILSELTNISFTQITVFSDVTTSSLVDRQVANSSDERATTYTAIRRIITEPSELIASWNCPSTPENLGSRYVGNPCHLPTTALHPKSITRRTRRLERVYMKDINSTSVTAKIQKFICRWAKPHTQKLELKSAAAVAAARRSNCTKVLQIRTQMVQIDPPNLSSARSK